MAAVCPCGELWPHYCPATGGTDPGYPGPDPGGPDVALDLADWRLDAAGVIDQ